MNKLFVSLALAIFAAASTASAQVVVYDSIPNPLPPNLGGSEGFQCCALSELGDEITLAGTERTAAFATITFTNPAKHSTYPSMPAEGFTLPVTFTIYGPSVAGSLPEQVVPGPVLGQATQTFLIPWRPEGNPAACWGYDLWQAADNNCYNGIATTVRFDLRNAGPGGTPVQLPNTLVYSIAFNTSTYGYNPIGQPGPYDSLNVAASMWGPTVGANVQSGDVFQNASSPYYYQDQGATGFGIFRRDTGWYVTWAVRLEAYSVSVAQIKEACKDDGWTSVVRLDGSAFKNQGDCVSYVMTGK